MGRQQTGSHGPRIDDQLQRETEALTRGAPDDGRTERRREQAEGDGEPDAGIVRDEDDEQRQQRAALAAALSSAQFPATAGELAEEAVRAHASPAIVEAVGRLPATQRFQAFGELWDALHPGEPPV